VLASASDPPAPSDCQTGTHRRAAQGSQPALDDQAYATALAARWGFVEHPHRRLGAPPPWHLLGFLLGELSESYPLMIT
jgi:hypothetical protein